MARDLLTGNAAAAWGARLADVDYLPAYPITPQTEIVELLAQWIADGAMAGRMVTLDSEHSMLTAAGAAAATGARVFTASSSQGLLYALEMLYTVAGWRVPFVLVNVSRAVAAPITLEPDHNDVLAARDTGFLQIHAETCQEVLDSILMAYRMAEHADVLLPALVNLDGFYLSFTREPVDVPAAEAVRDFLPAYDPQHARFSASHAMAQGVAVLGSSAYAFFKYQMQHAAVAAEAVHTTVAADFADRFGRTYGVVEGYQLDDADWVLVMSNSFSTVGKAEVARLRQQGEKVGLLRLRLVRPFPHAEIARLLAGRRGVAVIDQNLSVGRGGIFFAEIASALRQPCPPLLSFIGGLGGRRFRSAEFDRMLAALREAEHTGGSCEPHLLFTEPEYRQVLDMLRIAHGAAVDAAVAAKPAG
jgi:pyruvate ferredoxin oxidoreductase alpha subunit